MNKLAILVMFALIITLPIGSAYAYTASNTAVMGAAVAATTAASTAVILTNSDSSHSSLVTEGSPLWITMWILWTMFVGFLLYANWFAWFKESYEPWFLRLLWWCKCGYIIRYRKYTKYRVNDSLQKNQ